MNKKNLVPLLGIAFVVAVVTTGIFYGLFVGKLDATGSKSLVVAARELKPGAILGKEDLRTVPWSTDELPKGTFESMGALIGQTVLQAVAEGEPVFESFLANRTGAAGLAIPAGMRAVSSHIADSTGVVALLRPGHRVDVQAVTPKPDRPAETELRTILQNITVLSVNPVGEQKDDHNAPVVTFLVTPAEADALALADATTRVRLALRNPADSETGNREVLGFNPLLKGTAGPKPASANPGQKEDSAATGGTAAKAEPASGKKATATSAAPR